MLWAGAAVRGGHGSMGRLGKIDAESSCSSKQAWDICSSGGRGKRAQVNIWTCLILFNRGLPC